MEELNRYPIFGLRPGRLSFSVVKDVSSLCLWVGRLLMLGMFLVLVASPYTECAWHWDGFPQGGSDFELGLVACAAMICLALVVALQAKGTLARRLGTLLRSTGCMSGMHRLRAATGFYCRFLRTQSIHLATPPIAIPLQI